MNVISNMKVGKRLILGFLLIAIFSGIVGGIGIINIKTVDNNDTELYEYMTVPIHVIAEISTAFQRQRVELRQMMIEPHADDKLIQASKINDRKAEIEIYNDEFEHLILSDEMRAMYANYMEALNEYEPLLEETVEMVLAGRTEEAWEHMEDTGELGLAASKLQQEIEVINNAKVIDAEEKAIENTAITNKAVITMSTIIVGVIILAMLIGFALSKMISKPLKILSAAAEKLAVGETDINIVQSSKDEIGELMGAFGKMIQNIIEQSKNAEEIAKGNFDLKIQPRSDKDALNISLKQMVENINLTAERVEEAISNTERGKFLTEISTDGFEGAWKDMLSGIDSMRTIYVGYFDSIPIIVGAFNNDYRVEYINKTGTDLLGVSQESVVGKKCYDIFKTDDCKTKNCACDRAMKSKAMAKSTSVSKAGETPMDIDYAGLPMIDREGNVVGAFEIVMDQTEVMDAQRLAVKQAEYQGRQVENLIGNLDKLSQGDLNIKTVLEASDKDTKEIASNFEKINSSLESSTSSIKSYIYEISEVLNQMANKDFTVNIDRDYLGDFKQLRDSINYILGQFNEILSEINMAAEQVEVGADQVSVSSQSLSQGSSEQASSVEQMSTSITEVAEQTKENASNASKANELSILARDNAEKGNEEMQQMLVSMNNIKDSSNNIANIIKVIDDIAFQTNILALNAAVEAARAGEHGRGFAVVAEEVRNLAARSAQAAKETTALIDNSITEVNDGYGIAQKTAEALTEIVGGIAAAVDIVSEIASASTEQAVAIEQINVGVDQVSQVTQSNMATAEESAAASEQMASQSQELKQMIGEFNLKSKSNQTRSNKVIKKENKKISIVESEKIPEIEIDLNNDDFGKFS